MPKARVKRKTKAGVSIIGSDRLGTALAIALSKSGYRIQAVVESRSARVKKNALISRTTAFGADDLARLTRSQIVLITTPHDEIALTAEKLATLQGTPFRGRVVLHTSGALSSDVLAPLIGTGSHVGSLHPLVSADQLTGAKDLRGTYYCVEGDPVAARVARRIVRDLNSQSFSIPSNHKPLCHAAAVMASGHIVALFDIAVEMLIADGLSKARAHEVLLPILRNTVDNLANRGIASALTGTFIRGDVATVRRHLVALRELESRDALAAYTLLGRRSVELVTRLSGQSTRLRMIAGALNRLDRDLESGMEIERGMNLSKLVLRYEGELIKRALQASGGRLAPTARLLGITHQGLSFILDNRQKQLLARRQPKRSRSPKGMRAPRKRYLVGN